MSDAWQLFCLREAVPLLRRPSPEKERVRCPVSTEFQTRLRTENFVLQLYPSSARERQNVNQWVVNLDAKTVRWLDSVLERWEKAGVDASLRSMLESQPAMYKRRLGAIFPVICGGAYEVERRETRPE